TRRALQDLGGREVEAAAECRRVRRAPTGLRVGEDELADLALGIGLGMPQPGADDALSRLQVHVARGRGPFAAALMAQTRALRALVRRLVVGEACVAVDAEQRAPHRARVGAEVRADRGHRRLQVADQAQERLAYVRLVVGAVGLEPGLVVVSRQAAQEAQAGIAEVGSHSPSCSSRPQASSWSSSTRRWPSPAWVARSVAISAK